MPIPKTDPEMIIASMDVAKVRKLSIIFGEKEMTKEEFIKQFNDDTDTNDGLYQIGLRLTCDGDSIKVHSTNPNLNANPNATQGLLYGISGFIDALLVESPKTK